jgi:D-alanyl-D-alanine dipeptidase
MGLAPVAPDSSRRATAETDGRLEGAENLGLSTLKVLFSISMAASTKGVCMFHKLVGAVSFRRALAHKARRGAHLLGDFFRAWGVAALVALAAPARAGEPPPGFARVSDIAPGVAREMRYAGSNNFTGAPVPGYGAPACWLRVEAARALAAAQVEARSKGFDLVVYDCYRPRRAVAAFVEWSKNGDETTKSAFYPNVDKSRLFAEGYIATISSHSTGLAVDIGVKGWDFGTPFDFFDRRSWTGALKHGAARLNRARLVALMRRHGFDNYPREWWHFTLRGVKNVESYDVEIE